MTKFNDKIQRQIFCLLRVSDEFDFAGGDIRKLHLCQFLDLELFFLHCPSAVVAVGLTPFWSFGKVLMLISESRCF